MRYSVELALDNEEVRDFVEVDKFTKTKDAIDIMNNTGKDFLLITENKKPVGIFSESNVVKLKYENKDLNIDVIEYASKPVISIKKDHNLFEAINLMIENDISKLVIVDENDIALGVLTQRTLIKVIDQNMLKRNKYVKDIIKQKKLISVSKEDSLEKALEKLAKYQIRAIVVLEDEKPIGIITQKDFVKLISNDIDLANVPVKFYTSSPVITCGLDTSLIEASDLMVKYNIRRLVVVDENWKAIGIITQGDIVRNLEGSYEDYIESSLKGIRHMLNIMQDPVLELIDAGYFSESSGVIIWQNNSSIDIFGNLLGKHIKEIIDEYTWKFLYEKLLKDRSINHGHIFIDDKVYQLSCVYLEDKFKIINGRIKILFKDITNTYKMDLELKKINKQYQNILDSMDDMIIIYDAYNYKIKFANKVASEKLGHSAEELLGKNFFDIILNAENVIKHFIEKIIKENKKVRGRRVYIKKDGEFLPVHVVATKVYFENHTGVEHILIVARDISKELIIETKLRDTNKELSMLYSFITDLSKAHEEDEAYDILIHYFKRIGIDYIHMYRLNPSLNKIISSYLLKAENFYQNANGNSVWVEDCLDQDPSMCKVIKSGTSIVVSDTSVEYGCPKANLGHEAKSYMCVPIFVGGGYISNATAILSLISTKKDFFDDNVKRKINKLTEAFTPVLSNLRLIKINKELSIRDPLTEAYNRRFLDEILQKEFVESKRYNSKLSIIIIDVDNFKAFNDRYGHKSGDIALRILSNTVRDNIRLSDIFARYGGEEFVIVLPNTSKLDATEIANRIKDALNNKVFEITLTDGSVKTTSISASFGVATFNDDADNLEDLLRIADERLYKAKKSGKNTVVSA